MVLRVEVVVFFPGRDPDGEGLDDVFGIGYDDEGFAGCGKRGILRGGRGGWGGRHVG